MAPQATRRHASHDEQTKEIYLLKLLIDDWIETGAQAKAACALIERLGGKVVGITALGIERHAKTEMLFKKYECKPLQVLE